VRFTLFWFGFDWFELGGSERRRCGVCAENPQQQTLSTNTHHLSPLLSLSQKSQMKALTLEKPGLALGNFKIQDLPVPVPKGNQVLVKVHVAALNPVDW
jgi:hypothetical protein